MLTEQAPFEHCWQAESGSASAVGSVMAAYGRTHCELRPLPQANLDDFKRRQVLDISSSGSACAGDCFHTVVGVLALLFIAGWSSKRWLQ